MHDGAWNKSNQAGPIMPLRNSSAPDASSPWTLHPAPNPCGEYVDYNALEYLIIVLQVARVKLKQGPLAESKR
jgi:hypothetical protein